MSTLGNDLLSKTNLEQSKSKNFWVSVHEELPSSMALEDPHNINGSRDINLQSKVQFKSKMFQSRIDLNILELIEPH